MRHAVERELATRLLKELAKEFAASNAGHRAVVALLPNPIGLGVQGAGKKCPFVGREATRPRPSFEISARIPPPKKTARPARMLPGGPFKISRSLENQSLIRDAEAAAKP